MSLSSPEVLATNRPPRQPAGDRRRRWVMGALILVGVAAVAVTALVQLRPWDGAPATGVRMLVDGPDGLTWIDADSGDRTAAIPDDATDWLDFSVVSDTVVAREPADDPSATAQVVVYSGSEPPQFVGSADVVVPGQGSALWLVVRGDGHKPGKAELTSVMGEQPPATFDVPSHLDVVGAFDDGLVVAEGDFRYRRLALWNVHENKIVKRFGLVVGVREVIGHRALVTTGCLTSGCSSAVVNLATGRSRDVTMPAGFAESGAPTLVPGGVASVVVARDGSTRLAMGRPDALQVVARRSLAGVQPAHGVQAMAAPGGWLAITNDDGDVSLWRSGIEEPVPTVDLAPDERLLAVRGS
ncbi:MAG TPA: hypothetical protein VFX15_04425 [Actinomycetes bacterium]|nr:hypothetical protein [Actinomycetes bacterium]